MISEKIKQARLEEVCDPRSGDCEQVALSLYKVLDADRFVCIYEPGEHKRATHAAVEKDGQIYDGKGKISEESMIDYLSGLKSSEFPDEINNREDIKRELLVKTDIDILNVEENEKITKRLEESFSS